MTTVQVICQCGQTFTARVADRKRGWGKFCSKSCKATKQVQRGGKYTRYQHPKSSGETPIDDYDGSWDSHNY